MVSFSSHRHKHKLNRQIKVRRRGRKGADIDTYARSISTCGVLFTKWLWFQGWFEQLTRHCKLIRGLSEHPRVIRTWNDASDPIGKKLFQKPLQFLGRECWFFVKQNYRCHKAAATDASYKIEYVFQLTVRLVLPLPDYLFLWMERLRVCCIL